MHVILEQHVEFLDFVLLLGVVCLRDEHLSNKGTSGCIKDGSRACIDEAGLLQRYFAEEGACSILKSREA